MNEPKPALGEAATTQSGDPLVGAQLGEYTVQHVIGSGGMGIVYRGVQPLIEKSVAIKVLLWEIARNPEEVQRLLAEARLVNSIRHRGIVDIYAFGETPDGRSYLVMELLEGDPLDKVIAERAPLVAAEVFGILDEVCDALSAAHGAGVIHRDLKPNNVFLVNPKHGARYVKLLDFGLAKKTLKPGGSASPTRASIVVGTPYYMAPEQARAQDVSPQTDLYALGVLAFELLTGKLPFEAPTPFEVIALHLNQEAPRVRSLEQSVPEELDEIVAQLLSKDPADRPSSAAWVRRELLRIRNRMQTDATQLSRAKLPERKDEGGAAPQPGIEPGSVPLAPPADVPEDSAAAVATVPLPAPEATAEPVSPATPTVGGMTSKYGVASCHLAHDTPQDQPIPVAPLQRPGMVWGVVAFVVVVLAALLVLLAANPRIAALLPFDFPAIHVPALVVSEDLFEGMEPVVDPSPSPPHALPPLAAERPATEPERPRPPKVDPPAQAKPLPLPTEPRTQVVARPVDPPRRARPEPFQASKNRLLTRIDSHMTRLEDEAKKPGKGLDSLWYATLNKLRQKADQAKAPPELREVEQTVREYEKTRR
ncbi:MAG: protein kinase [Deltaproteobacteria bacterium]|nr:protein kinase [Deltaproteobacteria bacterium]